jgi:hypothetical protein
MCAGKIAMEQAFPNLPNEASDNGTACHIVAAECLTTQSLEPSDWLNEKVRVSDDNEPPRFVIFEERLVTFTTEYVDTIKALTKGNPTFAVERRVEFSEYVGVDDQFGTIDAHWLNQMMEHEDAFEIVICDLKTGYHFVDTSTPQLKFYALGVLRLYDLTHDVKQIRLMIFQPTHGGMREEVISVAELLEFAKVAHVAAQRVERATELYPVHFLRGSSHERAGWAATFLHPEPNEQDCAWCRAMATCPAATAALENEVGTGFDVIDENAPEVLAEIEMSTDTQLATHMRITGFLEDWITAVRAEVERRLLLEKPIKWGDGEHDGFGLELGREGPRKWKDPDHVEELLRKTYRLKMEVVYDMKLISPTSAEKLAKVKKPKKGDTTPVDKPVLTANRWADMQKFIERSPPKPSVKLLAAIKEPYSPVQPDETAFDVIEEPKAPSDGVELW